MKTRKEMLSEVEAHARLIAAAPEMLDALHTLRFALSDDVTNNNGKVDFAACYKIMDSSIAKAESRCKMNHLKNGTIVVGAPGSVMRLQAEREDAAKEGLKQCAVCLETFATDAFDLRSFTNGVETHKLSDICITCRVRVIAVKAGAL